MTRGGQRTQTRVPSQSMESLKVILHTCITFILYKRTNLPKQAFRNVWMRPTVSSVSYKDFLHGIKKPHKKNNAEVTILVRGTLKRVDRFLDILENGVFPAVEHGYVSSMQLTMCLEGEKLPNVTECWTFAFEYGRGQNDIYNVGIMSPDNQKTTIQISNLRNQIQYIQGRLENLLSSAPRIPGTMNYHLALFYNKNCPKDFSARGFNSKSPPGALKFPVGSFYRRKHSGVGAANFDDYKVGMAVDLLELETSRDNVQLSIDEAARYTDFVRKEVVEDLALSEISSKSRSQHSVQDSHSFSASQDSCGEQEKNANAEIDRLGSHDLRLADPSLETITPTNPQSQDSAQVPSSLARQDAFASERIRKSEQKLIAPISSGLEKTLSNESNTSQTGQATAGLGPPRLRQQVLDAVLAGHRNRNKAMKGPFSQGKPIQRSDNGRFPAPMNQIELYQEPSNHVREQDIECVCSSKQLDWTDMIRCNICLSWQHLDCIGYSGVSDIRIPDVYVCFFCLLDPELPLGRNAKELNIRLKKVQGQAFANHALRRMQRNGFPTGVFKDIAKALGCGEKIAKALVQHFYEEGVLQKNAPFSPRMYDLNIPEKAGKKIDAILNTSLDLIAHCYESPPSYVPSQEIADDGSDYQPDHDSDDEFEPSIAKKNLTRNSARSSTIPLEDNNPLLLSGLPLPSESQLRVIKGLDSFGSSQTPQLPPNRKRSRTVADNHEGDHRIELGESAASDSRKKSKQPLHDSQPEEPQNDNKSSSQSLPLPLPLPQLRPRRYRQASAPRREPAQVQQPQAQVERRERPSGPEFGISAGGWGRRDTSPGGQSNSSTVPRGDMVALNFDRSSTASEFVPSDDEL